MSQMNVPNEYKNEIPDDEYKHEIPDDESNYEINGFDIREVPDDLAYDDFIRYVFPHFVEKYANIWTNK